MTEFGQALLDHTDRNVIPKLKYTLAQAIDTQRPTLVVRAIMLIAILVTGIRPLPEGLEPFLLDRLRRLVRSLSCEDYTNMTAYAQLVDYVLRLNIPANGSGIWIDLRRLQDRLAQTH